MSEVLRVRDVSFVRNRKVILDSVDLTVRAGEHWALLGANGAGKSTLLSLCGAVAHPTRGTVEILGRMLGHVDIRELRESIGHVNPRHPLQSGLTVETVVLTGATGSVEPFPHWEPSAEQLQRTQELIRLMGLEAKADESWLTLSQGERGRTLIARALLAEPSLLLLDEPSTGLDVAAREHLLETIDSARLSTPQLASVLVTHHLEELPSSTTHALLIKHGRVVASGPADDVITTENISDAFEFPIGIERSGGRWQARAARVLS